MTDLVRHWPDVVHAEHLGVRFTEYVVELHLSHGIDSLHIRSQGNENELTSELL